MEVTQRRPVGGDWQGWSSTRRGTLAIAALATLIAAGILVFAMNRYRQSVNATSKQVPVLVATRFIEKGTAGSAIGVGNDFKIVRLSEKQLQVGALANAAALRGEVAAQDIYPNQQLAASDFVSGGLFYSKLQGDLRAVSVPVDTSHGLVGNIQTGDRADVYVSFPESSKGPAFLRLVAPNAFVLDAGRAAGGLNITVPGVGSGSTSNVVLEVNAHQAAELAFSADNGKVWLVLRPAHGTSPNKEVVNELTILAENASAPGGGKR
jgi:Flp pilus assembly protein CpaB